MFMSNYCCYLIADCRCRLIKVGDCGESNCLFDGSAIC